MIKDVAHLARTYSKHAPVKLTIAPPGYNKPCRTWRLQPVALLDAVFHSELGDEIQDFFQRNKGSVDNVETISEAFKVTVRGFCISKGSGVLQDIQGMLRQLETELKGLETQLSMGGGKDIQNEFREKLSDYTETADRKRNSGGDIVWPEDMEKERDQGRP